MLVGNAGLGKSVLVGDKLNDFSADDYIVTNVPFNYYTTSEMLQGKLNYHQTISYYLLLSQYNYIIAFLITLQHLEYWMFWVGL